MPPDPDLFGLHVTSRISSAVQLPQLCWSSKPSSSARSPDSNSAV